MAFRRKMRRGKSKRLFTRTARRVHKRNRPKRIMRGGYRI
jgi:hypothetical protein